MRKVTHEQMANNHTLLIANTEENTKFLESKGYKKSGRYNTKENYICLFGYSKLIISNIRVYYLDTLCELIKEKE